MRGKGEKPIRETDRPESPSSACKHTFVVFVVLLFCSCCALLVKCFLRTQGAIQLVCDIKPEAPLRAHSRMPDVSRAAVEGCFLRHEAQ